MIETYEIVECIKRYALINKTTYIEASSREEAMEIYNSKTGVIVIESRVGYTKDKDIRVSIAIEEDDSGFTN